MRLALNTGVVPPPVNPRGIKDRWNLWLYRVDGNVDARGEQLVKTTDLSSSVSAARTTDDWKINLGMFSRYNARNFNLVEQNATNPALRDTVPVTVLQREGNANALIGRTLNAHWTAGVKVFGGFSEVLNQTLALRVFAGARVQRVPVDGVGHPPAAHGALLRGTELLPLPGAHGLR
ncbi:MAG: hypothetical protein U5K74_07470 [Gemmatimonadaceae bacterium]|nr:hypothetical protein [Gemmatimonadaceae bacterium]